MTTNRSIDNRISQLEGNVVNNPPNFEETSLYIDNEAERQLHKTARQFQEQFRRESNISLEELLDPDSNLLEMNERAKQELQKLDPQGMAIIEHSRKLLGQRVCMLFIDSETAIYPEHKSYFMQRLLWFISEFYEYVTQQQHATIIEQSPEYQATLDDDNAPDLIDEYFKTVREVFTVESWDKWVDTNILPILRKRFEMEEGEKQK